MMIAKAEWKVVSDVKAKLSLVVSLGHFDAVERRSLFITLGPRPCPVATIKGRVGLTKLDCLGNWFREGPSYLSRPEDAPYP